MTARKPRKGFIVKLTHESGSACYVSPTCGPTPAIADAARFLKRRDAQGMGERLCSTAAYNGDALWTFTVEVEP